MIEDLLSTYGYLAILIITFLEGESIVILAGIAAAQGYMEVEYIVLCALIGSFCGDQFYYTIGRRFGTPLLDRWPALRGKTEWAFRLVRKHETLFILSFRFLYGVRNVSPFVIAMAGVPRLRFMILNFIAALIWALSFTFGGYYLGHALEAFLGENKIYALAVLAMAMFGYGIYSVFRKRNANRLARAELAAREAAETQAAEAAAAAETPPAAARTGTD